MDDKNNLLSKGMVIEGGQLRNFCGVPKLTHMYFGEGLIDIKIYYPDALNETYYLFMYESEDEIKFVSSVI